MERTINQSLDLFTYIDKIDVIGDIHGCYHTLVDLLHVLGYKCVSGIWQHPHRIAVFIGDYIDRGIYIPQVLDLIKKMVDNQHAIALLGNHEMNLVGIYSTGIDGQPLRSHKKIGQHHVTIKSMDKRDLLHWLEWFKQLPFFLDLGKVRFVHAAWRDDYIDLIKREYPTNSLKDNLSVAFDKHTKIGQAIRYILKGPELVLPPEVIKILDKKHSEYNLHEARIRWWDKIPVNPTYRQATLLAEVDKKVEQDIKKLYKPYPEDAPILFFGHYSMTKYPHLLRHNVQCVDFGVYKKNYLAAYRYNGEDTLTQENIVFVPYNKQDVVIPSLRQSHV